MRRRQRFESDVPRTVESLDEFTTRTGLGIAEWRAHRLGWSREHRDILTPLDALLGYLHVTEPALHRAAPLADGTILRADGTHQRAPRPPKSRRT